MYKFMIRTFLASYHKLLKIKIPEVSGLKKRNASSLHVRKSPRNLGSDKMLPISALQTMPAILGG